ELPDERKSGRVGGRSGQLRHPTVVSRRGQQVEVHRQGTPGGTAGDGVAGGHRSGRLGGTPVVRHRLGDSGAYQGQRVLRGTFRVEAQAHLVAGGRVVDQVHLLVELARAQLDERAPLVYGLAVEAVQGQGEQQVTDGGRFEDHLVPARGQFDRVGSG